MGEREELQIVATFDICPNCGSARRFAWSVAREQIEKGVMGEDIPAGVHEFAGPLVDPRRMSTMLVGTMVPMIYALIDFCLDCGTPYAVRLMRGESPLQAVQGPGQPFGGFPLGGL